MNKARDPYIVRKWEEAKQSKDRRVAPRYSPQGKVPVCLGWQQDGTHFYTSGEIINISVTGILLKADQPPPQGQPVWLRLEDPHPTDWVQASVVRLEHAGRRPCTVRMTFLESCPYPIFKAVINGFNTQDGLMSLPQDLKNSQWW